MEEIWKRMKNFDNKYMISTTRRIINLKTSRELKKSIDKDGYQYIGLTENGKNKSRKVHRLVASAFIPNPDSLPQVNHKDENKQNNSVDNLEWCTNKYNSNYGNRNRLISSKHSNFVIIQKDLNNNIIKIWDDIYELTHSSEYNYQHIRDHIRKHLKPKKYIWEKQYKN